MEGYVIVEAAVANGKINTLSTSGTAWGDDEEGQEPNTYWLYWRFTTNPDGTYNSGGYTGIDWYWNDNNNYLQTGWSNYAEKGNYSADYTGFTSWLAATVPTNLNDILGDWPSSTKQAFIDTYYVTLRQNQCLVMY